MKAKNILVIIAVSYVVTLVISAYMELDSISKKSRQVQMLLRTSADMALSQAQTVDEYLAYSERASYSLLMPSSSGNGFVEEDLYAGIWGIDATNTANKEEIFRKMYLTEEFKTLSTRLGPITKPVRYYNDSRTGFVWYYAPVVAMMGLDVLPSHPSISTVKTSSGGSSGLSREIFAMYDMDNHIKTTSEGEEEYFSTPISLGLTYVNKDFISALMMNNVDLYMRLKNKDNLNTYGGGKGVLTGQTYSDRIKGNLSQYNPIHNGEFTVLRGTKRAGSSSVEAYSGVTPKVEYKVIDMYNSSNDRLLIALFGAKKDGMGSKASYLRNLDSGVINPATGSPHSSKPIVVAKVTFYLDVVIPYHTVIMRELRGALGSGENFIDIKPTIKEGMGGTRRISYTRFFAVTP